ncbi:MAG: phage holin family protein [Myxococcota bacterium]
MFDSLRAMLATLVTLAHTRLELVSVELEQEGERLAGLVLWAILGLFCGGLAVLMLALTIVIAFWDGHRLLAAGLVALLFTVLAMVAGLVVRHRLRTRPRFLSATIGELERDARALGSER